MVKVIGSEHREPSSNRGPAVCIFTFASAPCTFPSNVCIFTYCFGKVQGAEANFGILSIIIIDTIIKQD